MMSDKDSGEKDKLDRDDEEEEYLLNILVMYCATPKRGKIRCELSG